MNRWAPAFTRQDLLRPNPVGGEVYIGYVVGLFVAAVPAYQLPGGIRNGQRNGFVGFIGQEIVDNSPIGWILTGGFFWWEGSVGVHVPANAVGALWFEEHRSGFGHMVGVA